MLLSRENQRGNQEWIVQKHWRQSALKTQDEDKESNKTRDQNRRLTQVLAKRNLLLIRHPASPAVLLIYIVCLVTDGGKLRKNENVHCHIYEIWLFRNDQPDHDYDPRFFVAMTSTYIVEATSLVGIAFVSAAELCPENH